MPGFDKIGPRGAGPMTGRGLGPCGLGLGWRRQFGLGRGKEDQKEALTEYKKALEEELEDVKKEEEELK